MHSGAKAKKRNNLDLQQQLTQYHCVELCVRSEFDLNPKILIFFCSMAPFQASILQYRKLHSVYVIIWSSESECAEKSYAMKMKTKLFVVAAV